MMRNAHTLRGIQTHGPSVQAKNAHALDRAATKSGYYILYIQKH